MMNSTLKTIFLAVAIALIFSFFNLEYEAVFILIGMGFGALWQSYVNNTI